MDNIALKVSLKLSALLCMGGALMFIAPIQSYANDPAWLPLGTGTKQASPSVRKYPRLYPGTRQVNFFIQGASLSSLLSKNLSTACARGNFNQKRNKKYYVIVPMPNGSNKKFGFADYTGINLSDPGNRKGPNQAYLFDNDKTSECKVYAAVTEW